MTLGHPAELPSCMGPLLGDLTKGTAPCSATITKRVGPHTLRHAFITATLVADVPLRDVQVATGAC